ncbi:MAG: Smr/MutS family protein [Planctomycetota bacterium]
MARRRIRGRALRRASEAPEDPEDGPPPKVDLHGMRPEQALVRLGQALHTARVRGDATLDVVTGRGLGNPQGKAVLRPRVEAWLAGPEGRRFGVQSVQQIARGGCLRLRLATRSGGQ